MHGPNTTNLVKALDDTLEDLDLLRMIHLSMDGPNTNWAVLSMIQNNRQEKERALLVNLQSCGLHVVSGALQTGVSKTNWNLEKVCFFLYGHMFFSNL